MAAGVIADVRLNFVREPLATPFGFKGGALTELWQVVCGIGLDNGSTGLGVGVQSVLWAEPDLFGAHSEAGGNALMLAVTERALALLRGRPFAPPPALLGQLLPPLTAYAEALAGGPVEPTFVLNALVPVDFALWQLQAAVCGAAGFDALAADYADVLPARQLLLGNIPLVSYDKTGDEIGQLVADGAFLLKVKIGAPAPDTEAMLRRDCERLAEVHALAGATETPFTDCGHPVYYLDANGRYDGPDRVRALLEHAAAIGALARIVLLEEPYPTGSGLPVGDLPVTVAADESAHFAEDIPALAALGYRAVALKPVAKTLSGSLEMLRAAGAAGMACFCADLTVPPVMLEWNMHVAARLAPLPGVKVGVVESNGAQNYPGWNRLLAMAPDPGAAWLRPVNGVYPLGGAFYTSGAFMRPAPAYAALL